MTLKQKVKEYLELQPLARERRYRARTVWNILYDLHRYTELDKERFCNLFSEIQSINRWITKWQQLDRSLRGSDYNDKFQLQQKAQIDLGYESGYNEFTSKRFKNKI